MSPPGKAAPRPLDWLAYAAARLGWPGLIGLGMLLAALISDHFLVLPLENRVAEMEARADRLSRVPRPARAEATEQEKAARFADSLPLGSAAPEAVARLFAAASHAGLSLEQGSYRPGGNAASGLGRYQISLPVSGDYPSIRGFLAESLERQPTLALDSLSLSRESIASPEVKARMNLTFYLREAP